MVENIEKVSGLSMDIEGVNKEKLKSIFPECFVEGKLDIDKLLNLCGEYIDNDFEKYKFEWKGKSECYKIAGKRSTGTLRPCPEESVNFDTTKNMYIEGDNLEVLKLLQTSYYRKVKMIYIDPPYNTGNDFVYEDDFKDPMAKYKEVTQQTTKSNPETMGRFHTNWLNMMYPRLRLAANLLRDDGVIFISIDDNEITNLRKLCDEVFGEENFVGDIIIKSNPRGSQSVEYIAYQHEHILIYAKNFANTGIVGHGLSEDMLEEYKLEDENGKYRLLGLRQRGGFWRRSERPLLYYPIYVNTENGNVSLNKDNLHNYEVVPYQPSTKEDGTWRWSKEKFNNEKQFLIAKKIMRDGNPDWDIFQKDYLYRAGETPKRTKAKSLWDEKEMNYQNGSTEIKDLFGNSGIFPFTKPKKLIEKCIEMVSLDIGDIVLDLFSGSATTAHAVMQLNAEDGGNRHFIMVQLPELCDEKSEAFKAGYKNICEIGKERIRRAGKKMIEELAHFKGFARANTGKDKPEKFTLFTNSEEGKELQNEVAQTFDVGFKVFKLDTSNLVKWDSTPTEDKDEIYQRMSLLKETIKPDRNDLDVVYEVMLKLGIPLDYPLEEVSVNDKRAYSIGEDCLVLICLDYGKDGITADDVKLMCEDYTPAKIVASEQAFKDDVSLSNAHYILKDHNIEMKLL